MSDTQIDPRHLRIALLIPTVELGGYWRPVIAELVKISERVVLYTARPWAGFDPEDPATKYVEVVGEIVRVTKNETKTDYSGGYMKLSTKIVDRLLEFKPQVIVVSGFSMWTILALLFKPIGRWKIVLAWEGSSPNVDFRNSKSRILMRNLLAKFADTFITNSAGGKSYLVDYLKVDSNNIQIRPYLVPDTKTLLSLASTANAIEVTAQSPVFLYVGRIEERKGLHLLLQACHLLRQQGAKFSLLVIGRGPQQDELKAYCQTHDLDDCVQWLGWIDYRQLGLYFDRADVFMFPSLEDTWGMVALEAMAFGKPVLCSKWAGVAELITDGKSGFICDPKDTAAMAKLMQQSIEQPELISAMGIAAKEAISPHTPAAVAKFIADISLQTLKK
jgi:glycosyltransferase involved in cell wall biosynthesis